MVHIDNVIGHDWLELNKDPEANEDSLVERLRLPRRSPPKRYGNVIHVKRHEHRLCEFVNTSMGVISTPVAALRATSGDVSS